MPARRRARWGRRRSDPRPRCPSWRRRSTRRTRGLAALPAPTKTLSVPVPLGVADGVESMGTPPVWAGQPRTAEPLDRWNAHRLPDRSPDHHRRAAAVQGGLGRRALGDGATGVGQGLLPGEGGGQRRHVGRPAGRGCRRRVGHTPDEGCRPCRVRGPLRGLPPVGDASCSGCTPMVRSGTWHFVHTDAPLPGDLSGWRWPGLGWVDVIRHQLDLVRITAFRVSTVLPQN